MSDRIKTISARLIFAGVAVLVLLAYFSMNYSGFCFGEWRYLSDEEKLNSAVTYVAAYGPMGSLERQKVTGIPYDGKHDYYQQQVPYESAEEFLRLNPDCCALRPKQEPLADGYHPTFWEEITGQSNYVLRVNSVQRYRITPIDENRNEGVSYIKESKGRGLYPFGNCGMPSRFKSR